MTHAEPTAAPLHSKYDRLIARAKGVHSVATLMVHPCDQTSLRGAGEAAAPTLRVTVMPADVRNSADIERAVTEFSGQPDRGLIIAAHVVFGNNIDLLGTLQGPRP